MSIKTMLLGAAALAGAALPGVANAQYYGGQTYRDGYYGRYYGNDNRDYDRHAERRFEQRRRWEERERRHEWERHHRFHDRFDRGYEYDRGDGYDR